MSRRGVLVLAGILLLQSVVVARVFTPRPHDGGDNAGYVILAHSILERGAYLDLWNPEEPPHTKYPPVFALLLAGAIALGAKGWAALKLVPAFSMVLTTAFAFLWAQERRGLAFGVGVALLVGLSESVIYYSQWVLSDPTFLAFTMAALWAFQRIHHAAGPEEKQHGGKRWLGLAMVLVVLAFFTRSAGLPLVVAALLWLGVERRWVALAVLGALVGVPGLLWVIRGRGAGGDEYISEFWLLDPYRPELGTAGIGDLLARVVQNLEAYVTVILPGGIVGDGAGALLPPLGLALIMVAAVGWIRALIRERAGVAELFFPLYFGLILLWPTPWSGDRFSLPLLPLLFYYSGVAILWLLGSFPERTRWVVLGISAALVALPAGREWNRMAEPSGRCREQTRMGMWESCLPEAQRDYLALAERSGRNLPQEAVVTTRKPRIFFLMSGVKSQSIPLESDPQAFLDRVTGAGSRYVSLDLLDGLSSYYVYPVVRNRIHRFCDLAEVNSSEGASARLLGVPESGALPDSREAPSDALITCPPGMVRDQPRSPPDPGPWGIPLLVW